MTPLDLLKQKGKAELANEIYDELLAVQQQPDRTTREQWEDEWLVARLVITCEWLRQLGAEALGTKLKVLGCTRILWVVAVVRACMCARI